jgi:hypothetical protein
MAKMSDLGHRTKLGECELTGNLLKMTVRERFMVAHWTGLRILRTVSSVRRHFWGA